MHYQFFYADQPHRPPPFAETIRRYANLISVPGERHQYSNLGYGLLDHVITRLSGQRYADFMRQEVFLPLGMTHASVDIGAGLESFQAIRYGSDGIGYPFYDFDHPGGSAVFCSAHDLVRFAMFHLKAHLADQKAILPDQTIDAMQIGTAQVAEQRSYGIGWGIIEDNYGYRSVGHGGGMGGVNTNLVMIPAERIAVVILANADTELPFTLAEDILAELLPAYGEKLRAHRSAPSSQDPPAQPDLPEWTPPAELLGTWHGTIQTYQGDFALKLWFKHSGDIHAQIGDQLRALVNQVKYDSEKQTLSGRMHGTIITDDACRRPHELQLDLKLRDQQLNGAIYAITASHHAEGGAPDRRMGNALGYWAALTKAEASQQ
jgi:CubicO group peptidase (beta-lactamase class C family)